MCLPASRSGGGLSRAAAVCASLFVAAFLLCSRLQAQTTGQTAPAAPPSGAETASPVQPPHTVMNLADETIDPNQPIKPNFVISISVVGETQPSGNYQVDPAGSVGIKFQDMLINVPVAGRTPAEAEKAIAKALHTYIRNPQVQVAIVDVPHPTVSVVGAVQQAGYATINNDTTLAELLSHVGLTDNADLTQIRITRTKLQDGQEHKSLQTYDFDRYFGVKAGQTPDDSQNPLLKDKDVIFVPYKELPSQGIVSVYGEVKDPQKAIALPSGQQMTVREAINLAHGALPDANRKEVTITRTSSRLPLVIDLDKAESGDPVNDVVLQPNDSIYVEKLQKNDFVNVDGAVLKPGKIVYDGNITLTQAVMDAGGPLQFAKLNNGIIYRRADQGKTSIIKFNWTKISQNKEQDIALKPGDNIWIQQGTAPAPGFNIFGALSAAGSLAYIWNTLSGGYAYHP